MDLALRVSVRTTTHMLMQRALLKLKPVTLKPKRQLATQCATIPYPHPLLSFSYRAIPILPLRCSAVSSASAFASGADGDDAIILRVGGMMCEGCADNVKRILESRPQVLSATVNLASQIAIVSPVSEEKSAPNWRSQLGEALANHLTGCGFDSTLTLPGQELTH